MNGVKNAELMLQFIEQSKKKEPKTKKINKTNDDIDIADSLMSKPKAPLKGQMAHFPHNYPINYKHQVDVLYLTHDEVFKNNKNMVFKYALVVVDIGSRLIDAEPMTHKTAKHAVEAINTIYNRKKGRILQQPKVLFADAGSEFKGEFKTYCEEKKIYLVYGKKYRHRQLALVESANARISRPLYKRMLKQEVITGEESREWVLELPKVIKQLNKERAKKPLPEENENFECVGDDCNLLDVGDKVRVLLDAPVRYVDDQRLQGYRFRATDHRWSTTIKEITEVILTPNQPPQYGLDNDKTVLYTKYQLKVVSDADHNMPDKKHIAPAGVNHMGQELYEYKIVKEEKKGKLNGYIVQFQDNTQEWKKRSELSKQAINAFEKKNKTKSKSKKKNGKSN